MKYTPKINSYYDLKEVNMKKRNAVNNRRKSTTRGIETTMTEGIELQKDGS